MIPVIFVFSEEERNVKRVGRSSTFAPTTGLSRMSHSCFSFYTSTPFLTTYANITIIHKTLARTTSVRLKSNELVKMNICFSLNQTDI